MLKNPKLISYSKELQELAKNNLYYSNAIQFKKQTGTMMGMFVTQCGTEMLFFPVINNILADGKTTNMVCLGDVLHKAGYKQYYYGGADSELFNKKNLFYLHGTDEVYGREELKAANPDLKMSIWGIYDYDLFEILKKKYVEYEKKGEPFTLTAITTSTHNPDGVFDARCKNTHPDNQMINAIECTSFLVNDFINFLKKQKHFDDTLIILLPDHRQYYVNGVMDILNEVEKDSRLLFMIAINGKKLENKERFVYTQVPEFIIKELGIETNAVFMGEEEKEDIVLNFNHKMYK
ncbi:MAG: hypothetical protein Ta2D_11810 [Rickettsiales bacterium]|nr:MAG: hypothetical protein Ta2D_11810 [Rickettsiales bacterium]